MDSVLLGFDPTLLLVISLAGTFVFGLSGGLAASSPWWRLAGISFNLNVPRPSSRGSMSVADRPIGTPAIVVHDRTASHSFHRGSSRVMIAAASEP
jgi:hypothetical protein